MVYRFTLKTSLIVFEDVTLKLQIWNVSGSKSANDEYIDTILDSIEKAHNENCIMLVVGYLNIDCGKPNTQLRLIENLFGLTQLVAEHTRVTNNSSSSFI